jgi:hypothetical protein
LVVPRFGRIIRPDNKNAPIEFTNRRVKWR